MLGSCLILLYPLLASASVMFLLRLNKSNISCLSKLASHQYATSWTPSLPQNVPNISLSILCQNHRVMRFLRQSGLPRSDHGDMDGITTSAQLWVPALISRDNKRIDQLGDRAVCVIPGPPRFKVASLRFQSYVDEIQYFPLNLKRWRQEKDKALHRPVQVF